MSSPQPMDRLVMDRLVKAIEAEWRDCAAEIGSAAPAPEVMAALRRVPRELFVPLVPAEEAYGNWALPIGHGQTISQPFIVALMTDLLDLRRDHRVLEVGTGSGYQAAVLAELLDEVHSIEAVPELAEVAAERLRRLGYHHVRLKVGDGWQGWPEAAPFDRVIVTAAAPEPPPALLAQLKPGGRMVVPLGEPASLFGPPQWLTVLDKAADGTLARRPVIPVAFVPLVRG